MITDKYQLKSFLYVLDNSSLDELNTMVYIIEGIKKLKYGD